MFANLDLAIGVSAMCAVGVIVPSLTGMSPFMSSDVALFLITMAVYFVLMHFKRPPPKTPCWESTSDNEVNEALTTEPCESSAEPCQVATEPCEANQLDVTKHIDMMQKYASERNIGATMRTFKMLQQNDVCLSSFEHNIVLQAWINCGNVQAAEDWMDEMQERGVADEHSFDILIKALVATGAWDRARDSLLDMGSAGIQANITAFDRVLSVFARENKFDEGISLLEDMHSKGLQPTSTTHNNMVKLVNGLRSTNQSFDRVQQILKMYGLEVKIHGDSQMVDTCIVSDVSCVPLPLPNLTVVVSHAEVPRPGACLHEVRMTGSLAHIKNARRMLKRQGFFDKAEKDASPLDGHWETEHGLTVIIEGKLVRWSAQRASRLRFTSQDRRSCELGLYGENSQGRLIVPGLVPNATKTLRWTNGDIWHAYAGRTIGSNTVFSQTMTKPLRDKMQDQMYHARTTATLKCVSKQSLGLPAILESAITEFIANDLYYVSVVFESKWNPSHTQDASPFFETDTDMCTSMSLRHPRIGIRHCWADNDYDSCGQRTLVNGEEVDDACFNRHIRAVSWA